MCIVPMCTYACAHACLHTVNPEKFGVIKISSGIRCTENLIHKIFLLRRHRAILIFTVHLVSARVHIHEEPRKVLWPCGNTFGVRKTFLILEDQNATPDPPP